MSIEPPLIKLGEVKDVNWPDGIKEFADESGVHLPERSGSVLSTRDKARELQAEHGVIPGPVILDARAVESATPTYFDQLLMFWPNAQLIGANDDVLESFELAQARRRATGQAALQTPEEK